MFDSATNPLIVKSSVNKLPQINNIVYNYFIVCKNSQLFLTSAYTNNINLLEKIRGGL